MDPHIVVRTDPPLFDLTRLSLQVLDDRGFPAAGLATGGDRRIVVKESIAVLADLEV
jgi:hypothetical protein